MSCLFPLRSDALRRWARLAPDRVALVDRVRSTRATYAELSAGADRWAALLRRTRIGRGDLVATLAGNRVELIEAFYACGRIGAALVPLNWRLAAAELAPILADARPALILGEGRFRRLAEDAARAGGGEPRWLDLDLDARLLPTDVRDAPDDVAVEADEPWLILYTSGSTGRPKGAVLPHRQILWNALATTTAWELGSDDIAPVSTPLFHTGGWNVFATPLWERGGRVVLMESFDPRTFLDAMAEERCTVTLTVPTQLVMLVQQPEFGRELPALKAFMSGGAPLPQALAERVRAAGYRIKEGYGLTECGPNCFATSFEEALRRPGSVGWPIAYLSMRLDAGGREAEVGEAGELLLRGPQMFAGYLRDPERTAEAVTPDGWLRTGDLARRDAEGAYSICGRRKEMFISGGENVFPGEVEAVLAACPGVAEVCVVGVPDPLWGEVGCAFVVRGAGATLAEADVVAFARSGLAGYKAPKSVVFLETIPRLGSGKADRQALAAMVPEPPAGGAARAGGVETSPGRGG